MGLAVAAADSGSRLMHPATSTSTSIDAQPPTRRATFRACRPAAPRPSGAPRAAATHGRAAARECNKLCVAVIQLCMPVAAAHVWLIRKAKKNRRAWQRLQTYNATSNEAGVLRSCLHASQRAARYGVQSGHSVLSIRIVAGLVQPACRAKKGATVCGVASRAAGNKQASSLVSCTLRFGSDSASQRTQQWPHPRTSC